ncbi:hypothetical protein LINGRAHAP2_LOCUS9862 [Linum grandiflorum]
MHLYLKREMENAKLNAVCIILFMPLLFSFTGTLRAEARAPAAAGHAKLTAAGGGGILTYQLPAASAFIQHTCPSTCKCNSDCAGCGTCSCATNPKPFCDGTKSCLCYYCP